MEWWVAAEACTLPTAEQPLRVAEFDRLFADDVIAVRRESPTRVVLDLQDRPGLVDDVADLTARETECCSFFTFSREPSGRRLELVVEVPEQRTGVLTGLAERAARLAEAGRS